MMVANTFSTFTMLCAKLGVLATVLRSQPDSLIFGVVSLIMRFVEVTPYSASLNRGPGKRDHFYSAGTLFTSRISVGSHDT
jgi:hypothetical protein